MKLNLTSKLLSLFVVAAITLTSCGSDDDPQPNNGDQTACKVTAMSIETMFGSFEGTAVYNSDGKISKVVNAEDNTSYTLFKYDSQSRLVREENYEGDELIYYAEYSYTNGNITMAEWFFADDEPDGYMTVKYDGSNRVTEVKEFYQEEDFEGEVTETVYTTKHTYNSQGNVAKSVYFTDEVEDMTITYESYDNKINVAAAMKGNFDPWSGNSKNNPLKATTTFIVEDESQSIASTYAYVYNDNNLPTKITITTPIGNFISNFTYLCK
jgi:hypothetical protein